MENRSEKAKAFCAHAAHDAAIAACSHHQTEKATALLSDEHRVIERVLGALEKLTEKSAIECLEPWKKALDFIRNFADRCHHVKEEKVLFPALEEHGIPNEGGPIGVMLQEHEEGRALVRTFAAGDPATAVSAIRRFVLLLREHITKENEVLFPMSDQVLPPAEQAAMMSKFEQAEAEIAGPKVHQQLIADLERLEAVHK